MQLITFFILPHHYLVPNFPLLYTLLCLSANLDEKLNIFCSLNTKYVTKYISKGLIRL